jgi:hypothetical protein
MRTNTQPHHIGRENGQSTYMSRHATPPARTAFAIWGLMSEIVGAAIVVFGSFFAALALAGTALVMFF